MPRKAKIRSEDILEELEVCVPYGAREIASWFDDVSVRTIYRRLEDLHDEGRISRKKIPNIDGEVKDNSPVIWYRPSESI